MTIDAARLWLAKISLIATTATFMFFLMAPGVDFPLEPDHAGRLLQIVAPVWIGYMGMIARYVFGNKPGPALTYQGDPQLFTLMVKGPVISFAIVMVGALAAFYLDQRGPNRTGRFDVDRLAMTTTAALALLTATTNLAMSFLFNEATVQAKDRSPGEGEAAPRP